MAEVAFPPGEGSKKEEKGNLCGIHKTDTHDELRQCPFADHTAPRALASWHVWHLFLDPRWCRDPCEEGEEGEVIPTHSLSGGCLPQWKTLLLTPTPQLCWCHSYMWPWCWPQVPFTLILSSLEGAILLCWGQREACKTVQSPYYIRCHNILKSHCWWSLP